MYMGKQIGIGELLQSGAKATRKQKFLADMESIVPFKERTAPADADTARDKTKNSIKRNEINRYYTPGQALDQNIQKQSF